MSTSSYLNSIDRVQWVYIFDDDEYIGLKKLTIPFRYSSLVYVVSSLTNLFFFLWKKIRWVLLFEWRRVSKNFQTFFFVSEKDTIFGLSIRCRIVYIILGFFCYDALLEWVWSEVLSFTQKYFSYAISLRPSIIHTSTHILSLSPHPHIKTIYSIENENMKRLFRFNFWFWLKLEFKEWRDGVRFYLTKM